MIDEKAGFRTSASCLFIVFNKKIEYSVDKVFLIIILGVYKWVVLWISGYVSVDNVYNSN